MQTVAASTFGLFVFSSQQAQMPFGAGFLCVAQPFDRLPFEVSPAAVITPGSTWNPQAWFRDNPATPPFNTSDGTEVLFSL